MNAKEELSASQSESGFTFIDLMVTVAVIAILALTLAPALAKSDGRAGRVSCFNNKRHIQTACAMYSAEWNDWLLPAAPAGSLSGWCKGTENWAAVAPNIYPDYYTNAPWPYVQDLKAYKCPNDRIPSDNGNRIRSISMNPAIVGQLSDQFLVSTLKNYIAPYRVYFKTSDLTVPSPANTWIFCDESMYSVNDGYLQVNPNMPGDYPDVPAAYDNGGNCFSFADGHVEYRRWQFHDTRYGILNCPYRYNTTGVHWQGGGALDLDWAWLRQRTSAL